MIFYNNEVIATKLNDVKHLTESITQSEISKFISQITERTKRMDSILVIDRFEGNYAICENNDTGEMIDIEISKLPKEIKEGTVLKYKDGNYIIDLDAQTEIESRITKKMNRLWNN